MNQNKNFNELLLNMLNDTSTQENDNVCLISNEILKDDHVTLFCNHSFNYKSIYNEIKKQKEYNYLETQKLSSFQIKCPYCRNIQDKLLPYNSKFAKIMGVNYPLEHTMLVNKCKYIFKSGKRKNLSCNKYTHLTYCSQHQKIINKRQEKIKNKKEKTIDKNNKLKKNNYTIELLNENYCHHFLLRGKNKGKQCSYKKNKKNGKYCTNHYKFYKNKELNKKCCIVLPKTSENTVTKKNSTNIKINKKITI
tara:strand:- start:566 stop:1315 length:750 start_codon:yes stop_codon:yes gene_type:complete